MRDETDQLARLNGALARQYRIERELGQGGMATVYLAHDLKHDRDVALKVLRPELAAVLGAERFLAEIRISAKLDHPHILTLIDSGQADGFLWYVLPYVRGESLRQKLEREHQLGIPDALAITKQIAGALAYAHRQGVIHRDIKPENILLQEGEAVLTDFGIALAVKEAAGTRLTETGLSLGTPQYMSPEQATAERQLDARSDVYSLGAVLYEMLTGDPPHSGSTAQAVIAKLMTERPTRVRTLRDTVPEGMDAAVAKALAKTPADRFATAAEFARALDVAGMEATPGSAAGGGVAVPAAARVRRWWPVAAVIILGLLGLVYALRPRHPSAALDPSVVAVPPFRVAGAEPSLHYLREGMIDLLAAKLTGEGGGLRAADPRTVTDAWRRAAGAGDQDLPEQASLQVARGLGAGRLLLGGVVGSPAHLVLSAKLVMVAGGGRETQASVEGPAESLPAMLDGLTGQLLVGSSGLGVERQASLTTTSLDALQAYLAGQAAYRRGRYGAAVQAFSRALRHDSSFALAAFALVETAGWLVPRPPDLDQVNRLAWAGRDRLSARDRALLDAYLGPDFPAPPRQADLLAARERAVQLAPDSPDAWYFLGEEYVHAGAFLGYDDWRDRATAALEHAVALDSSFAGPLYHLVQLAAWRDDTAAVRLYGHRYLADTATGREGLNAWVRWELARTLHDSAMTRAFWATCDSSPLCALYLTRYAQWEGAEAATVDSIAALLRNPEGARFMRATIELDRGHPRDAASKIDSLLRGRGGTLWVDLVLVLQGLYQDGDSALTALAARQLAPFAHRPQSEDPEERAFQYASACELGQWQVDQGRLDAADHEIARLRGAATPRDSAATVRYATTCAALLEAMAATYAGRSDARRLVERADLLMRRGPVTEAARWTWPFENLLLAHLFDRLGDAARGLAAVRRRGFDWWEDRAPLLSSYLREEGRLAALAGDTAGAIDAYRRYLKLRPDPEPSVKPEVDRVRAELARLVGEH